MDRALEKRGLVFARYADNPNVNGRSRRAAEGAMATPKRASSVLRLRVNEAKSAVARIWDRTFARHGFWVVKGRGSAPGWRQRSSTR